MAGAKTRPVKVSVFVNGPLLAIIARDAGVAQEAMLISLCRASASIVDITPTAEAKTGTDIRVIIASEPTPLTWDVCTGESASWPSSVFMAPVKFLRVALSNQACSTLNKRMLMCRTPFLISWSRAALG